MSIVKDAHELLTILKMWNYARQNEKFRKYYRKHPITTDQFNEMTPTMQHYVRCLYLEGNLTVEKTVEYKMVNND
jgi:hypothetical protein